MSPELTGFALGLLLGAAKVMAIATVVFGVAWWRARLRIKALEAELSESGGRAPDRLQQLEDRVDRLSAQLDQLKALPPTRSDR